MPQVVVVDEIGTEAEALACRTIAERGVQLIGTAHGCLLENLIKNPTLADLVGGVAAVTLGDEEARARGTQKTVRAGAPVRHVRYTCLSWCGAVGWLELARRGHSGVMLLPPSGGVPRDAGATLCPCPWSWLRS